jgi:hypothetical protein
MKLSFRPHHFLCTLGFQGAGYSPHFVDNCKQLLDFLQKNEDAHIQVVSTGDSICKACPHLNETGCVSQQKIHSLDTHHAQILTLQPGDWVSWKEAKQRLKERMTLEKFHAACLGCEWKGRGVCEAALKELQTTRNEESGDNGKVGFQ